MIMILLQQNKKRRGTGKKSHARRHSTRVQKAR
jgi:hypothetical protein